MRNIESSYINKMDRDNLPPQPEVGDQGLAAEEIILNFFEAIPGVKVQRATAEEDSGLKQIRQGLAVDEFVNFNEQPGLAVQATTATDSVVRDKKKADLMNRPFVWLPEEKTSIPRVLIFLDAKQVAKFVQDPVIEHHPELGKQIVESSVNSLNLCLMKTKNPREVEHIQNWLQLLEQARLLLADKKSGKPN